MSAFDTDAKIERQDREALIEALTQAGATVKGNTGTCPWHEDRHPSGSIHRREDGAWAFKCHVCKINEDVHGVRLRNGQPRTMTRREAKPTEPKAKKVYPTVEALVSSVSFIGETDGGPYVYTNPDTKRPDMIVVRLRDAEGKKTFLQASSADGAGFKLEAPSKPWPLYNRTRLRQADAVVVVEGEKCVHALTRAGVVATTSPGGAGKAAHADWRPLAGKRVYLWPDADPVDPKTGQRTGLEHMREVASVLERIEPAPEILWIDPDLLGLPPKGDAVDWLEAYASDGTQDSMRRAVGCILEVAQPMGAARDLEQLLEDTIAGRRKAVPWPWPAIGRLSKALLPGTVTCLCGDPGSTKSLLLLEAAAYWHRNREKVALYELEDDRAFHLNRVLAQLEDNSDLTDDEWVRTHADETRAALERQRSFISGFGSCVHTAPDAQVSLEALAAWVRARCVEGCRIIAIDPITAATASDKPWLDDLRFLMSAKSIIRQYGASLILVTHPRKGNRTTSSLSDLAGGAAFPRFAHTVFWIEPHAKRVNTLIATEHGDFSSLINRTIRIRKARNGAGGGLSLGYDFDGKSLRFAEQGVVVEANETSRGKFPDRPRTNARIRITAPPVLHDPFD